MKKVKAWAVLAKPFGAIEYSGNAEYGRYYIYGDKEQADIYTKQYSGYKVVPVTIGFPAVKNKKK